MTPKPRLSFWQLVNMSFGFFGIQFGWGLQIANMSGIYAQLGAKDNELPLLWLAGPMTGLIVQPIIGHMSDRTWTRLGRRRPYFLVGALLASAALLVMPNVPALWMAAGLLWILDASINISMEPFRAFVADLLPDEQRATGFAMQSLFIGLGAVCANLLPYLLHSVRFAFSIGAVAYISAVVWTVATTKEHPPEDLQALKKKGAGIRAGAAEIMRDLFAMPRTMRQLAVVQLFTWFGLFCMFLFLTVAVARDVFHATPNTPEFQDGQEWAGLCYAVWNGTCFLFSMVLPRIAKAVGRKLTHSVCLFIGAIGLASISQIHDKYMLFAAMAAVGIAWSSILSMPYTILAGCLPAGKTGIYMGIFNFFIVLPEIIASLGLGKVMEYFLGDTRLAPLVIGGVSMALAAVLMVFVHDEHRETSP